MPAPSSVFIAGLEATIVGALFMTFAYLLVDVLLSRWVGDRIIKWALALPAFLAWITVLQVIHMWTRGHFFRYPILVWIVTIAVTAALLFVRYRRKTERIPATDEDRRAWIWMWAAVGAGLLLWGIAVYLIIPLDYRGDTGLHTGWAASMMAGETTGSGPLTGEIPNYYPWLYHAILAFLAWFTPGHHPFHALGPVQIMSVAGCVLGLFALGRELTKRWTGGASAAFFGALTGGIGYVLVATKGVNLVMDPRGDGGSEGMRYVGDLIFNRSYNFAYQNLAPAFPRDVAFAVMPALLLLLFVAMRDRVNWARFGAGVLYGSVLLMHEDSVLIVFGTLALLAVLPDRKGMFLTVGITGAVTIAIWCLWTVPLFVNFLRYGFVNTARGPVILEPLAIIGGWGIILPFAIYGMVRWLPRSFREPGPKLLFAWTFMSAVMVFIAPLVPKIFGSGFKTLGLQHRYWPFFAMGAALYAAVGAARVIDMLRERSPRLAAAATAGAVLIAFPSPALGTYGLYKKHYEKEISRTLLPASLGLDEALLGDEDTVMARMLPNVGKRCIAAVAPSIGGGTYSYTGYRYVLFVRTLDSLERLQMIFDKDSFRPLKGHQLAHLRWRKIFKKIGGEEERIEANRILTEGTEDPETWQETAEEWGVDVVVAEAIYADAPGFADHQDEFDEQSGEEFVVIWIDEECDD